MRNLYRLIWEISLDSGRKGSEAVEVRGWMAVHSHWQEDMAVRNHLDTRRGKFNMFECNQMKWCWSVRKKRYRRIKILSLCMEMAVWTLYTEVQLVKWNGSTEQAVHKGCSAQHKGKETTRSSASCKNYAFLVRTMEEGILQGTVIRTVEGFLVCAL